MKKILLNYWRGQMFKAEKILLIVILISIVVVGATGINSINSVNSNIILSSSLTNLSTNISESIQNESNIYPQINIRSYITANGMNLTIGEITNNEDNETTIEVPISFYGKDYLFNITISPRANWTYAIIDGILIVPKTDVIIDEKTTSYYPSGKQLIIGLKPNNLKEIQIYSTKEPTMLSVAPSYSWSYNPENNFLTLKANRFYDKIKIYFIDFEPSKTVFIEDRKRIEDMSYLIVKLINHLIETNKTYAMALADLNSKVNEFKKLEEKLNLTITERDSYQNEIPNVNQTNIELENKITANILLSPSHIILGVIVIIVLIVILIDEFLFVSKKE